MAAKSQKTRKRRGSDRVTMKDVAELAGVAPITVSRVLSGNAYASPAIRETVMDAVKKLGYVPNRIAGGLASACAPVVPILVPALQNAVFADMIMGVQDHLQNHGMDTLIGNTLYSRQKEEQLVSTFLGWSPRAIMITGGDHTQTTMELLSKAGIPVVELMELVQNPLGLNVGISHFQAGYDMTAWLVDRGYEDVAFMGTLPDRDLRAYKRMQGFKAALRDRGLKNDKVLFQDKGATFRAGAELCDVYLEHRRSIRAIFCSNDVLAVGLLMECRRRNIDVPGQLAITGFNDLPVTEAVHPRLTTVHVPRYEIGKRASSMLLDQLAGKKISEPACDVGYQIVQRESA